MSVEFVCYFTLWNGAVSKVRKMDFWYAGHSMCNKQA